MMDIFVSLPAQTLELFDGGSLLFRYTVSTAKNGAGEETGSYCTPRGHHVIRAKIGGGMPENTVFVGRRPTGEIWTPELAARFPDRDWMLTRILWLSGKELGFNRLGTVDTMRRYIYLHGSPDAVPMREPGSIGCVRMRNRDIVELFDRVPAYTPVNIGEFQVQEGHWPSVMSRAYALRDEVFVREQGVAPTLERDGRDVLARHALVLDAAGNAIGYGRLVAEGRPLIDDLSPRIGRMAVATQWRHKGVGSAVLRRLIEFAHDAGARMVMLSAQRHAVSFYARFGFIAQGEEYSEAGIPHLTMTLALPS